MAEDRFDIEKVHKNFEASLKDAEDVILDYYLEGFRELFKYEALASKLSWRNFINYSFIFV